MQSLPTASSWVLLFWFDEPHDWGGAKCNTQANSGRNFEGQKKKGYKGKWQYDAVMITVLASEL